MAEAYLHDENAGSHGDVFKHVVFVHALKEAQKAFPNGIVVVDAHCGGGVTDVTAQTSNKWKDGIGRILQKHFSPKMKELPLVVQEYVKLVLATTGAEGMSDFELYPGSPLLAQAVLRPGKDEHHLCDLYVEEVSGLGSGTFEQIDAFDPKNMDFLLPMSTDKHKFILLDPPFVDEQDYGQTKQLATRILERDPFATIVVWIPFKESRFRYSFATGLKDLAKDKAKIGRYYTYMNIGKTAYEGSGLLVINPTPQFDDIIDDNVVQWLSTIMNNGKDEFHVEQIMKKKKVVK